MSTSASNQESDTGTAGTAGPDASKPAEPDPLRAHELELWDRVLHRWNMHIGRQVKIGVSVVSTVIVVVGFLGVRSLDKMVEDTVKTGVTTTEKAIWTEIEKQTLRHSENLVDKLATMTVEVSALEKEAEKARDLVDRMEAQSKRFEELKAKFAAQLESVEGYARRFEEIETHVDGQLATLTETSAAIEGQLKSTQDTLARVTENIERVDQIATTAAYAAATATEDDTTRLSAARPSVEELGSNLLDTLGVRQVPTPLARKDQDTRATYLLTTSVFVDDLIPAETANKLLDSIESVTYTLSERWFKNNVLKRTNRQNNFQFTLTVWGRTTIKAKAEFVGKAPPICWSGLMDLEQETRFKRVDCSAA